MDNGSARKMGPLRVIMVDDHTLLREGLKNLLEVGGEILVTGQAGTAEEGLEKAVLADCDALLVDISLPDRDGLWLVRQLREHKPDLPVLMLSMHTEDRMVLSALEAGANGYVPKSASSRDMVCAIQEITQGRSYIHSRVAASVLKGLRTKNSPESSAPSLPGGPLTPREQEILTLAAHGFNSQAIAERLYLSVSTVKTHLRGLYRKLDVTDRTQAVLMGIQRGLVDGSHLQPEGRV